MEFDEQGGIVKAWMDEVLRNRGVHAELTLKYCTDIAEYGERIGDERLLGFAYYYSGETYYALNDVKHLFYYMTRALSYLERSKQWNLVVRAYNILAIASLNRGNVPIAMDYYLTGLGYCRTYSLPEEENLININLGALYLSNGQYREAQDYFEKAERHVRRTSGLAEHYSLMACIGTNLGRCYLLREMPDRAAQYVDYIDQECWESLVESERLGVLCFRVGFYHRIGRISRRDECIDEIHSRIEANLAVMDIFDDLYGLCELLLELEKEDVFWDILNVLEKMTQNAGIVNLKRRIISLKIKYYRGKEDHAGYLQAAALFYELTETMERENRYVISNMLFIRSSLEQANEKRREVERENEQLQEKSETDPLTHLANRFRLNDYSKETFERAFSAGRSFAVEILDIDYFKEYNDNYGHQAGDACIVAIAEELSRMQRENIFCARYGGDEFVILYEGMTPEAVFAEAKQLRARILERRIEHAYSKALPVVTISQGICYDLPSEGNRSWDFLHAADAMLYRVKKRSRNDIAMGRLDGCEMEEEY